MYTVNFVGLNYFNACMTGEKKVLIPNGTRAGGHMPTHYASVFVEADRVAYDTWWPDQRIPRKIKLEARLGEVCTVDVIEFRIPRKVELRFRCSDEVLSNVNLDDGLPKLQDAPGFKLDLVGGDTIAEVPIPGGAIEAFRFGSSALVRWLIREHKDPITITARDGEQKWRITLKQSDRQIPTEIVFSNTIELLPSANGKGNGQPSDAGSSVHSGAMPAMSGGAMPAMNNAAAPVTPGGNGHNGHGYSGHFMLYAKLDWDRDENKFMSPDLSGLKNFRPLPFHHPYLAFLCSLKEVPDPPCVPSCC